MAEPAGTRRARSRTSAHSRRARSAPPPTRAAEALVWRFMHRRRQNRRYGWRFMHRALFAFEVDDSDDNESDAGDTMPPLVP